MQNSGHGNICKLNLKRILKSNSMLRSPCMRHCAFDDVSELMCLLSASSHNSSLKCPADIASQASTIRKKRIPCGEFAFSDPWMLSLISLNETALV